MKKLVASLVLLAAVGVLAQPATAQCAPASRSMGGYVWYDLLNNPDFTGTSCSPDWVGVVLHQKYDCSGYPTWESFARIGWGYGSPFSQDFVVPSSVATLEVSLTFDTIGSPSWWDRLYVTLKDTSGNTLERLDIRTDLGPYTCRRVDHAFSGSYAGQTLRLEVSGQVASTGNEFHIDSVNLFGYL